MLNTNKTLISKNTRNFRVSQNSINTSNSNSLSKWTNKPQLPSEKLSNIKSKTQEQQAIQFSQKQQVFDYTNRIKNAYNSATNSPRHHIQKIQKKLNTLVNKNEANNKIKTNQKLNPYLKKFNVRRLTKTQESASLDQDSSLNDQQSGYNFKNNSSSKPKYKNRSSDNKNTVQKLHLQQNLLQKINSNNVHKNVGGSKNFNSKLKTGQFQMSTIAQKFKTISTHNNHSSNYNSLQKNNSIKSKNKELFKKVPNNRRIQTEETGYKARLTDLQKSPYKRYLIKVDNVNIHQNTHTNALNQAQLNLDDAALQQKKKNYPFLTKFQLEEIQNYQIYYPGQRRIGSLRHFTDNNGNAKISIGDSIIYRYEIKGMLGQGSFGQVFKAYDHKKKEHVALKIIKNTPKFNAQAKVEIKILENTLMHDHKNKSNIVRMKHAFVFRGHACLTFELLHINLYEFLKITGFNGMSTDLIRRIAIQILQGLQFLHKFDIIHCDLKPQNILLKQQNKTGIKIIDVGSGCYENQQIYTYIQSRFYRAPQIILGLHYTSAIDMWSFGCILCQLYLGYPIFPGQNQQEQILMFMELLGVPSQSLIDRGTRSRKFFIDYDPKIQPNSKGRIRNPSTKSLEKVLKGCDDKLFIQFILKCFQWIPQKRITPKQALLDEWIMNGLPQELRQQHRQSVIKNHFY